MGDKYIESFDEKSIMIHRILSYKSIEYKNNVVTLESLRKTKGNSIGVFPMIKSEERVYHTLDNFYEFLINYPPMISKGNKKSFAEKQLMQWALDSLSKKVRYFLLIEPDNWKKLEAYLESMYGPEKKGGVLDNIRNVSKVVYKNSLFSRMHYEAKLDALCSDLLMIDEMASKNDFLMGSDLCLADFAVFSVLHLLMHPFITEMSVFNSRFLNLERWALNMEQLSKGAFTKPIGI